jgi:hypothetical protein
MSMTINGTSGLTFNDASTQNTAATGFGFKNRIINGAMMIDQRNAGASVAIANDTNQYTLDRWEVVENLNGALSAQQVTDAPTGFVNSLKITVTTAATSIGSSEFSVVGQKVEGLNISDLGWGSANASTVTLSFWIKCSSSGTFGGSLRNSGSTRSYPFSYVVNAANTWEQKTVTIVGDTTGTWLTTNGIGIRLAWSLGDGSARLGTAGAWNSNNNTGVTGQTQLASTLSATWQVTGVQLEKGSTATSFDYRPYGTELALCQRYYAETTNDAVYAIVAQGQWNGSVASAVALYPQEMRAVPTVTALGTNAGSWYVQQGQTGISTGSTTFSGSWGGATNRRSAWLDFSNLSGGVSNAALTVMRNNQSTSNRNGCLSFNAEL